MVVVVLRVDTASTRHPLRAPTEYRISRAVCNLLRESGRIVEIVVRPSGSCWQQTARFGELSTSWFAYSPHVAPLNHFRFARSVLGDQQPGRTRVRRQGPRGRVGWLSRSLPEGPSSGPAASVKRSSATPPRTAVLDRVRLQSADSPATVALSLRRSPVPPSAHRELLRRAQGDVWRSITVRAVYGDREGRSWSGKRAR